MEYNRVNSQTIIRAANKSMKIFINLKFIKVMQIKPTLKCNYLRGKISGERSISN